MSLYTIARFAIRPDSHDAGERAMHELASHVRAALPRTSLTIYRVGADYLALVRSEDRAIDAEHLAAMLRPHVAGELRFEDCSLVTSSDLQRRRR